jgi:hypothetical protein
MLSVELLRVLTIDSTLLSWRFSLAGAGLATAKMESAQKKAKKEMIREKSMSRDVLFYELEAWGVENQE